MTNLPTNRPRRKLFASGRIAPKLSRDEAVRLTAQIDTAGLRITSTIIPQCDAGYFVVEMEAAAQRYEMQRAIRAAA